MKTTTIFHRTLKASVICAAVSMLAGCGLINEPCRECPGGEEEGVGSMHLSFSVASDAILGGSTRSDSQGHPEEDPDVVPDVNPDEKYYMEQSIVTSQLGFYIFVGEGPDAKLLYYNDDINNSTDPYTMITGGYGSYSVTITLPNELLESLIGRQLTEESDETVTFRMVTLANAAMGFDRGNPYNPEKNPLYHILYPNHPKGIPAKPGTTTYSELIEAAEEFKFEVAKLYGGSDDNLGDVATGVWKGAIPMYGTLTATVSDRRLIESRAYDRVDFGNVWLLRSVAKIRVHDAIKEKTGGLPRLHSVELTYNTPFAWMLPANAMDYVNGTQVHESNPCGLSSGATTLNLPFISSADRRRIGYLPEQSIRKEGPELLIRIQTEAFTNQSDLSDLKSYTPADIHGQGLAELNSKTKVFRVPMTGFNGEQFTWGDDILRNHVYDLNVDFVDGIGVTVTAKVNPWEQERFELDFQENPVVSRTVSWEAGSYASVNQQSGEIYLRPWDSEENRVAAECDFFIEAPKGARWEAYLIPAGGATGSFMFRTGTDSKGDILEESVSGNTGLPGHLEIVSVDPNPSQTNSAILQVVVAMDGGTRFMEARVAGGNIKNWTVIQSKQ